MFAYYIFQNIAKYVAIKIIVNSPFSSKSCVGTIVPNYCLSSTSRDTGARWYSGMFPIFVLIQSYIYKIGAIQSRMKRGFIIYQMIIVGAMREQQLKRARAIATPRGGLGGEPSSLPDQFLNSSRFDEKMLGDV